MTATIQQTVYELVLSCGHKQMASRPLQVGSGYPCWTACDSEHVTPSQVVAMNRHVPEPDEAYVVCSGVSNGDMLHAQRLVDEANTKSSVSSPAPYTLQAGEAGVIFMLARLTPVEVDAYVSGLPFAAAVKMLQDVEALIVAGPGGSSELQRVAAAVKTRIGK